MANSTAKPVSLMIAVLIVAAAIMARPSTTAAGARLRMEATPRDTGSRVPPEGAWVPSDITLGHDPRVILVTRTGWRGGSKSLVIRESHDVKRLYALLAGNQRVDFTCGYHWNFLFEYRDGRYESIDINEQCEQFHRDPKPVWQELSRQFTKASKHPSHFVVQVRAKDEASSKRLVESLGNQFGMVFRASSQVLFVASQRPWTAARLTQLRGKTNGLADVIIPEDYDRGN